MNTAGHLAAIFAAHDVMPLSPSGRMNLHRRHSSGNRAATVPALPAQAFLAHPTRFERVTFAFRALLVTPPQPLAGVPGICRVLRYILKRSSMVKLYSVIPEAGHQDILENVKHFIFD
jgi:hypothetical protein